MCGRDPPAPPARSSSWMCASIPNLVRTRGGDAHQVRLHRTGDQHRIRTAPHACTAPKSNSSWRTLLPPKASPVQSSRLIHISMTSAAPMFGAGSSGVGAWPMTDGSARVPSR